MKAYQREFIEFALSKQVLKFGEFTLKSGRKSPYFFNAGLFNSGRDLAKLGRFYAAALVDDVITAGTAIRESMNIIKANGAALAGVLIALDRQEKGKGELSAIQEVERDYQAKVRAIITLGDLIRYLEEKPEMADALALVRAYRTQYGIEA